MREVCRTRAKQKGDGGKEKGISGKKGERRGTEWDGKGGHKREVRDIPAVYTPSPKSWMRPCMYIVHHWLQRRYFVGEHVGNVVLPPGECDEQSNLQ